MGLTALLGLAVSGRAPAEDWPHWRGLQRDARTAEPSGWNAGGTWLTESPAWRARVDEGAASPVTADDRIFTIGWRDGRDVVRCLDAATGKPRWEQAFASPRFGRHAVGDQSMYRGATATPEYDPESGLLFTLGCDGDLRAWDTRDGGKARWALNLFDASTIPQRPQITQRRNTLRDYGYTTSPLVHGDTLIVEAGDPKRGNLIGFDKLTGEFRWGSENRDPAGHTGGPVPITVDGVPCVAVMSSFGLHVARLDDGNAGKTAAFFEWKTDFSNTIAGVAVEGQDVLVSSRYNQMAMARLHLSLAGGVREVWRNRYPTGVCTPVIHGGKLYFANKGVHCVDFATGELDWIGGKIGDAGSCLVTGDERLIAWGNDGDISLLETARRSPDRCLVLAERPRIFDDMAWPHVVLAGGRLLVKTLGGDLACFEVAPR